MANSSSSKVFALFMPGASLTIFIDAQHFFAVWSLMLIDAQRST